MHDNCTGVVTRRYGGKFGIEKKTADVVDDVGSEFQRLLGNLGFARVDADENFLGNFPHRSDCGEHSSEFLFQRNFMRAWTG